MVLSLATISSFYGSLADSIIVQTGTVNDYFDEFSAHANNIGVTDPELLIPCFINQLNIQIYRKIFGKDYRSLLYVFLRATICEMNLEEDEQLDPDNQEDGDVFDEKRIYYGSDDRSATVVVHWPLPEPPDLNSVAVGEGEPESTVVFAAATSHRLEKVRDTMTGVDSGAENGAVAKGKVEDRVAESNNTSSSLDDNEVDRLNDNDGVASRVVNRTARVETKSKMMVDVATSSGVIKAADWNTSSGAGDPRRSGGSFRRVFPIMAKPPPLLAAAFPWNRDRSKLATSGGGGAAEGGSEMVASLAEKMTKGIQSFSRSRNVMENEIIRVLIGIGGTNQILSWRPWLPLMGQWQAQTHQYEKSRKVLFEILGCSEIIHGDKQIYWVMTDGLGYK
ncbi:hypothetical protein PIB30_023576 [Stylosanthes scabra]|uniref:Uncharacterized protein n=1 Tax=Stylosanthes scabra TaxID=79078 RepID=A0ABU6X7V0_9FABA|nr:hypothetical protein [Stylosanthes scabra]